MDKTGNHNFKVGKNKVFAAPQTSNEIELDCNVFVLILKWLKECKLVYF